MSERLLIPPKEAAAMLDISVKTLRTLTETGDIKSVLVGARRKYEPDDIRAFIKEQKRKCPSTSRRTHRTTTTTSRSKVCDFTAARAQRINARRSGAKTRLVDRRQKADESDQQCP